jgi:redox-sensitive bicupin YhaK (pirin superfamily)
MGRGAARVIRGESASDGAGVRLNRVIGGPQLPQLDPFLLLDEFRTEAAADYVAVARCGPFVMNTADEIERAMRDFSEGRM